MLRSSLKKNKGGLSTEFRYRGEEQTRIETLSDAVFALAITLMVLSSTIPNNYNELIKSLDDIIPFGISITLLMVIWYQHYIYFIRYGFRDVKIVAINTLLLFLILIYVYPLKFLFKFLYQLFSALIMQDEQFLGNLFINVIQADQISTLMLVYGIGASSIFLTLSWLYYTAFKRKKVLSLNQMELFITRTSIYNNLLMAAIPVISSIIIIIPFPGTISRITLAGIMYWLYPILFPTFHYFRAKKQEKIRLNIN